MGTKTIRITRRTRLGYGSTSTPTGDGPRSIATPREEVHGTWRQLRPIVDDDEDNVYTGGIFWRRALFVRGKRVVDADWMFIRLELDEVGGWIDVEVEE